MRSYLAALSLVLATATQLLSLPLAIETQRDIIERFMYVTGQRQRLPSSLSENGIDSAYALKCGTPAILDFLDNYSRLDRNLLVSMGVRVIQRPSVALQYNTPGGRMRIHYATTGNDAVFEAGTDINGNGVPDYVEDVGRIADSVYDFTINRLGYPQPVVDTLCNNGGDTRIDVYLINLAGIVFGQTWADTACAQSQQMVPGWIELDNDFQESTFGTYTGRPLDAVRVTLAHEFFHMIHFSLDFTESRALFEMSAVWMEEQQYDDLNDYYTLIPRFFQFPLVSLQAENIPVPLHNYASVVFMLYLSQTYGQDIVREIWLRAASLGVGINWLQAVDQIVDSASGGTKNLATSIQEFAVWNFFTGKYADWAPDDIGYEEKAFYPEIPVTAMKVLKEYPDLVVFDSNQFSPQINAASYLRFEDIPTILTDYWRCDSVVNSTCVDSTHVLDSTFTAFLGFSDRPNMTWGLSFILQLAAQPDSHEVISLPPDTADFLAEVTNIEKFQTITLVVTPTSIDPSIYSPGAAQPFGYALLDSSVAAGVDPAFANLPLGLLVPYPNPVVLSNGGTQFADSVTFQFDIPTDALADIMFTRPYFQIDVFTTAGERVATREAVVDAAPADRYTGPPMTRFGLGWNLKNAAGRDVASGVYLAYVHLYSDPKKRQLIAADKVKVAVIR